MLTIAFWKGSPNNEPERVNELRKSAFEVHNLCPNGGHFLRLLRQLAARFIQPANPAIALMIELFGNLKHLYSVSVSHDHTYRLEPWRKFRSCLVG